MDNLKREEELSEAHRDLIFQHGEIKKCLEKLNCTNAELKKSEAYQKDHAHDLELMLFVISHKVRQPIANILGLANTLDQLINCPKELKKSVAYMKESALALDTFTKELTTFINNLEEKKSKNAA